MTFRGRIADRPVVKGFQALEDAKQWERENEAIGIITRDCDGVAMTSPAHRKISMFNGLN